MLSEITGNLFDQTTSLAHCVSADFKMGKGIALEFRQRFGYVEQLLEQNTPVGGVAVLQYPERSIYYLVTKEKYWGKPTYATLEDSLRVLRAIMLARGDRQLAIPRLGCGLDQLEWSVVRELISTVFADSGVTIVVVTL